MDLYALQSPRDLAAIREAVRKSQTASFPGYDGGPTFPSGPFGWCKVRTAWAPNQTAPNVVEVTACYADGTAIALESSLSPTVLNFKIYLTWPPSSRPSSPLLKNQLALNAVIPFIPFGFPKDVDKYGIYAPWANVEAWLGETTADLGSGSYTVKRKDMGNSDFSPSVSVTARERGRRVGIKNGSDVIVVSDGLNHEFEYHGAPAGTAYVMLSGSSDTANSDTWSNASQGSNFGVSERYVNRLIVNGSNELVEFSRIRNSGANGHLRTVSAETRRVLAVLDSGAVVCSTPLPPDDASISASLTIWYRAEDISGADGSAITTIPDKSGNGNSATQSTSASKAILKKNVYNNKACIRADGSDDQYELSYNFNDDDFTLIACYKRDNTSGDHTFFSHWELDNDERQELWYFGRSGQTRAGYANSDNGTQTNINSVRSDSGAGSTLVVMAWNKSGTSITFSSDTGAQGTYTVYETANMSPAQSRLFAQDTTGAGQSAFFDGDLCEVAYYNKSLTANETEGVVCYMRDEYGL